MGFRFRKSFGKGPLRVNISKSGVGYSVGGKGFRYTKKAGGGTRTTVSIPGTGISYVKDSSNPKENRTSSDIAGKNTPTISQNQTGPRLCGYCHHELDPGSNICPHCGIDQADVPGVNGANKNTITELFLCIFLGIFGAHRFYVRKYGTAVLYLFTGGLFGIGWVIDIVLIIIRIINESKANR